MNNDVLGLMNKDIDQLQTDFKVLRDNQSQIASAIQLLTQQLSGMESAQLEAENAILKIVDKLEAAGLTSSPSTTAIDNKREGKEL